MLNQRKNKEFTNKRYKFHRPMKTSEAVNVLQVSKKRFIALKKVFIIASK